MKFVVGDRVRLLKEMYGGEIPAGAVGVVREFEGLVTYKIKFPGIARLVRVLEKNLERA